MAHLQNDRHTQFLTVGDLGEPPIAFRQRAIRGTHAHRYAISVSTPSSPRRLFDKVIKVEFEGALYDAPADYDEYLKILYADYMQIPPESQRITHCVKAIAVDL